MAKLTLNDIASGFQSNTAANTNNTLIENAIENTLSRDGTSPNQMGANLDMNSFSVVNVGAPSNPTAVARLVDISDSDATGAASATLRADLGASSGSSLVGFIQSGTGAIARTVQAKERDFVVAADFSGFDPTGVSDSTAAITAAFTSLGTAGGIVYIRNADKVLIDSDLTIPSNCSLKGEWESVGLVGTRAIPTYQNAGSSLRVNSTKTITLQNSSSLENLLIYRSGMTFPTINTAAYAGTAITIAGDQTSVKEVLVMGFNKGYYCSGYRCPVVEGFYGDNINGIEVTVSADVPYVRNCHMAPFSADIDTPVNMIRSGKAYYFHDQADDMVISNCFSYGYGNGLEIKTVTGARVRNFTADSVYPNVTAGITGIKVWGDCYYTKLIGCQTSACETGTLLATNADQSVECVGHASWGCSTQNIHCQVSGDYTFTGSSSELASYGIHVSSATCRVFLNGFRSSNITVAPIYSNIATTNVYIDDNCDFGDWATGTAIVPNANITKPILTAASPMLLPATGKLFNISGNTNFGSLNHGYAGREVTLIFSGTPTIFHSTGSANAIFLAGAVDFIVAANNVLILVHNGVQWYEKGRRV